MISEWDDLYRNDGISVREEREHQRYGKSTGRMYEGIEYRGFGQEIVEELAQYGEYLYGTD